MIRLLAAVALLTLPAVASAQVGTLGGRLVGGPPIVSGESAMYPVLTATPPRFSVGGGSLSEYPQIWLPSGSWGGVRYPQPVYPIIQPAPVPGPIAVGPQSVWSGQAEATLVLQFPAAAEVWVGGKKRDAKPAAEWILTSSPLAVGGSQTFEVKGRWKVGGKTFETSRSVTVTAGNRSRWIVVSGTGVKE